MTVKTLLSRSTGHPCSPSLVCTKIELTDLPGRFLIDETSVRVKGSGHCTILHVSYTDEPKDIIKLELVRRQSSFMLEAMFFGLVRAEYVLAQPAGVVSVRCLNERRF